MSELFFAACNTDNPTQNMKSIQSIMYRITMHWDGGRYAFLL